ncbi:MAG: transcription-repair coupling factor [Dictyoglomus sp. NZ13-RE01]|nr:MAG: transcription-repair coupling factor [Dictyoglomus sp. NZ13-RE01]
MYNLELEKYLSEDKDLKLFLKGVKKEKEISIPEIPEGAIFFLFYILFKEYNGSILWIVNQVDNLEDWNFLSQIINNFYIFPPFVHLPYEKPLRSNITESKRIKVLEKLLSGEKVFILASVKSLIYPLYPPEKMKNNFIFLKKGIELEREKILNYLMENSYERSDRVERVGQFCIKGGIIDIFSPAYNYPVRIEFIGDEIESIRYFDVETQRSIELIDSIILSPINELLGEKDEEKVFLKNNERSYIFDYLDKNLLIILEDFDKTLSTLEKWDKKGYENYEKRINFKEKIPKDLYLTKDMFESYIKNFKRIVMNSQNPNIFFSFYSLPTFKGKGEILEKELETYIKSGYKIFIQTDYREIVEERIKKILKDIKFIHYDIKSGFIWENPKILFLTDKEIFGIKRRRIVRVQRKEKKLIDLSNFEIGDYIVHINYGIGKFLGLKKLTIEGKTKEYIQLEYANQTYVYIPLEEMHLIQKYISPSGQPPSLSKIGTKQWDETKRRVKESVKEIAEEIIKMYARREIEEGFAFSKDTEWQRELEASFPYEETEDQLKALYEIKRDMESKKPMERVLIGDVGFGKTELALRASFKAVVDGKQVAVLVPTTILAYQHWRVFKDRLDVFPVKVEVLSRLKPAQEQKRILEQLKRGEIDIIIGTHRILQKDVEFKDLGLIIVDEEHRFGVFQKEGFKKKYPHVDILYLSATPIPRTLSMVLSGIRQFSILETPPQNRLPIETFVVEFNQQIIKEGIIRELERNGQVYYVCNDISRLESIAEMITSLVPYARVGIVHGKMDEEKITKVMSDFYEGKIDVLVATTIIESGLDVPNANTLFIENAEHMGLAQLYQLRGRIGRSNRQAYAYFMHAPWKSLSPESIKRLEALKEFSSLGSGLRLALRDLEIRGAGNLLGKEQHGHMEEVGFYLYMQLLEEAIKEIKQERKEVKINCKIIVPYAIAIPETYIENPNDRIYFYQRLIGLENLEELENIRKEMEDMYGKIPRDVENLFILAEIKYRAERMGIIKVEILQDSVILHYTNGKREISLPKGDFIKQGKFIANFLKEISLVY